MTLDPEVNNTESAMTLAQAYLDAGNYRRAEEVLKSALTESPQDAMLLTAVALAQHLLGDYAAAERSALGALAVAPGEADPMRVYAAVLGSLGRNQEALSWARRAVDAAPLDPSTHYTYAGILLNAGDAEAALPVATESLRLQPADADNHNMVGMVLCELGRSAESTAEYEEALRLEPGHALALHNIAVNHAKRKKFSSALAGFREAARLDPGIGDRVRHNVNATVLAWLRWMSFLAWVLLWVCVRFEHNAETTNPAPRIIAGCGAGLLLVLFVWLARSLPRTIWRSVFRRQDGFLALRIYIVLCAFVIGVLGAFGLGAPVSDGLLVVALLMTVVASWVASWSGRSRRPPIVK